MKKSLVLVMALVVMASLLAACAPAAPAAQPAAAPAAKPAEGEIYIPVISKGFQHQFWQAVKRAPRMPRRK